MDVGEGNGPWRACGIGGMGDIWGIKGVGGMGMRYMRGASSLEEETQICSVASFRRH